MKIVPSFACNLFQMMVISPQSPSSKHLFLFTLQYLHPSFYPQLVITMLTTTHANSFAPTNLPAPGKTNPVVFGVSSTIEPGKGPYNFGDTPK